MISLIKPVKFQILIAWDGKREVQVDIEGRQEGDVPVIYVKPETLREVRFAAPAKRRPGDPDEDPYREVARTIIEYATTGLVPRRGQETLTHGPVAGVGQIADLCDMLRSLHRSASLMASGRG